MPILSNNDPPVATFDMSETLGGEAKKSLFGLVDRELFHFNLPEP
jgi:hypothetical protein